MMLYSEIKKYILYVTPHIEVLYFKLIINVS